MPARGQTGNWGQGKWTGLSGGGVRLASQWLLPFWNLRLQSPSTPTPSLIVYLLALGMDCAFFKDTVQASAGGPDRTRLRAGCGPRRQFAASPLARWHLSCFLYTALPFLPLCLCLSCSLSLESPLLSLVARVLPILQCPAQATSPMKPPWFSPCAPSIPWTSFMTQVTSCFVLRFYIPVELPVGVGSVVSPLLTAWHRAAFRK